MSRYEVLANVRVGQLSLCVDCASLVPIRYRAHHDAWHHLIENMDAKALVRARDDARAEYYDRQYDKFVREPY